MNIDTLLDEADPGRSLTVREYAEMERLVDATHPRHRPRARFVIGIAALSALLLAGGGAAAAAAGIWHPSWYDPASDWTSEVKTVDRAFTVDGKRYHCTVQFTLQSTYNGKGTPEFQKALRYMRSLDMNKITPTDAEVDELVHATWQGQGPALAPPSKPWANQQMWLMDVGSNVAHYVSSIGLDPEKISQSEVTQDCDVTR